MRLTFHHLPPVENPSPDDIRERLPLVHAAPDEFIILDDTADRFMQATALADGRMRVEHREDDTIYEVEEPVPLALCEALFLSYLLGRDDWRTLTRWQVSESWTHVKAHEEQERQAREAAGLPEPSPDQTEEPPSNVSCLGVVLATLIVALLLGLVVTFLS